MVHVIHARDRVPADVVKGFAGRSVATVHEAQEKRGAMVAAIKPIYPGMTVLGTALTVQCQAGDNLMLHKAIDMVHEGEVIVCDVGGWEGGSWGEMMAVAAKARGCAGLVIDGYVRDGAAIRSHGFGVFARGLSVKGTFKQDVGFVNHPISCGGVVVRPGDLVLGDDDGVVVVAAQEAAEVLRLSCERDAGEDESRKTFAQGHSPWQLNGWDEVAKARGLTERDGAHVEV